MERWFGVWQWLLSCINCDMSLLPCLSSSDGTLVWGLAMAVIMHQLCYVSVTYSIQCIKTLQFVWTIIFAVRGSSDWWCLSYRISCFKQ